MEKSDDEVIVKTNKEFNWSLIVLLCLLLGLGMTVFTGCRTAHGFGEDMERAGQGIQRGADKD